MIGLRGWTLPEQHLLPEAVVAFVDGELSAGAHDRAVAHIMSCPSCAADVAAQRQARAVVRTADTPLVPATLLANLRTIPLWAELASPPENLAVTGTGEMVIVQRPDRRALDASSALGSAPQLGRADTILRSAKRR